MVPSAFGIRQIIVVKNEKWFRCKTVWVLLAMVCERMVLIFNDSANKVEKKTMNVSFNSQIETWQRHLGFLASKQLTVSVFPSTTISIGTLQHA